MTQGAQEAARAAVQARAWWYPFELPDGTVTACEVPAEVVPIHTTRRRVLREVVAAHHPGAARETALDLGCHQGYFSLELARHFGGVTGVDADPRHVLEAALMARACGVGHVAYRVHDLEGREPDPELAADFTLCYGLLYHLEDPLGVLRRAARWTRRTLVVESQILPYEVGGSIENGAYGWARALGGSFGLVAADPQHTARPGGLALVPSRQALLTALEAVGFARVTVVPPQPGDYEQYTRGHRVIVLAQQG